MQNITGNIRFLRVDDIYDNNDAGGSWSNDNNSSEIDVTRIYEFVQCSVCCREQQQ